MSAAGSPLPSASFDPRKQSPAAAVPIDGLADALPGTFPLHAWHLASLDAPTVAVCWLLLFALEYAGTRASALATAVFAATWVVYATDRLMDSESGAWPLHARHRAHRAAARWLWVLIPLMAVAATCSLLMAPHADVAWLLALAAILLCWFLVVHSRSSAGGFSRPLPKEMMAATTFAAVTATPVLVSSAAFRPSSVLTVMAFGVVLMLNASLITAWEGELAAAHRSARFVAAHAFSVAGCICILAVGARTPAAICAAASAGLLLVLDAVHARVQPLTLRALADVPLLTPAFVLAALAAHRL